MLMASLECHVGTFSSCPLEVVNIIRLFLEFRGGCYKPVNDQAGGIN